MECYRVWLILALALLAAGARAEESAPVYCVAKPDSDSSKLQEALDWTCGKGNSLGSVDCSAIQSGGSCFQPDTLTNHASYAFTLYYYHQSTASHACDFKGLATLTSSNPSSGTCVYPTTSQSSAGMSSSTPSDGGSVPTSPLTGSTPSFPLLGSPAPSPNGAPTTASISLIACVQVLLMITASLALLLLIDCKKSQTSLQRSQSGQGSEGQTEPAEGTFGIFFYACAPFLCNRAGVADCLAEMLRVILLQVRSIS
ncbi:hypothetical protein GOP47_0007061 [Adiantum capillus-veneris]|uniref:X8 domain-containing protein n=1 Tax=Adiantum capillus-veneris TaxID=13818 RepID=A0A9D4V0T1_ADICA|nr:hypothetical protein GOP47_0007061 [Adiantum capillus-veneris]